MLHVCHSSSQCLIVTDRTRIILNVTRHSAGQKGERLHRQLNEHDITTLWPEPVMWSHTAIMEAGKSFLSSAQKVMRTRKIIYPMSRINYSEQKKLFTQWRINLELEVLAFNSIITTCCIIYINKITIYLLLLFLCKMRMQ